MDLDQKMREYEAIRHWVKGNKLPGRGRIWRRIVHTVAAAVVPAPIRTHTGDLGGIVAIAGTLFLPIVIGYLFIAAIPAVLGNIMLTAPEGSVPVLPSIAMTSLTTTLHAYMRVFLPVGGTVFTIMVVIRILRA
jgi:hypothetical protein